MRRFGRWLISGEGARIEALLGRKPLVPAAWYTPEYLFHFGGNAALLFWALIVIWAIRRCF
jgi:hypothetical protein